MTEAYDLRSNIKGKPGSQGTLFQVKDKGLLNPQQRWPKGYTPERISEVRQATRALPITPPRWMDDERLDRPEVDQAVSSTRPRIQQALARSTVPVEHLTGLRQIHGEPEADDQGTYWPSRKEIGIDVSGLKPWDSDAPDLPARDAEHTLIHELGHHYHEMHPQEAKDTVARVAGAHAQKQMDTQQAERPLAPLSMNSSRVLAAQSTVEPAVHEALADNYYMQHYRTAERNPKPPTEGRYEDIFTAEDRQKHYPGYNDVRPPDQHLGPQFHDVPLPGMPENPRKNANKWAVGESASR